MKTAIASLKDEHESLCRPPARRWRLQSLRIASSVAYIASRQHARDLHLPRGAGHQRPRDGTAAFCTSVPKRNQLDRCDTSEIHCRVEVTRPERSRCGQVSASTFDILHDKGRIQTLILVKLAESPLLMDCALSKLSTMISFLPSASSATMLATPPLLLQRSMKMRMTASWRPCSSRRLCDWSLPLRDSPTLTMQRHQTTLFMV